MRNTAFPRVGSPKLAVPTRLHSRHSTRKLNPRRDDIMSSIRLVFEKSTLVSADGHYAKGLDGETPSDIRPAIQALVEMSTRVSKLYSKFMANDNRIVGTERSILIETIEDLALVAVSLMKKVTGAPTAFFRHEAETSVETRIHFHQDFWDIKGAVPLKLSESAESFAVFFNTRLSPSIKSFLDEYKTAASDSVISDSEKAGIFKRLCDILFQVFCLYFLLYHMRINE
jgi:hypothetical protein